MSHVSSVDVIKKDVQPIADRVAPHLEILSKPFQLSNKRTRILMGCTIYYLVLIVNPMGRILVLEIFSRFSASLSAIGCIS